MKPEEKIELDQLVHQYATFNREIGIWKDRLEAIKPRLQELVELNGDEAEYGDTRLVVVQRKRVEYPESVTLKIRSIQAEAEETGQAKITYSRYITTKNNGNKK